MVLRKEALTLMLFTLGILFYSCNNNKPVSDSNTSATPASQNTPREVVIDPVETLKDLLYENSGTFYVDEKKHGKPSEDFKKDVIIEKDSSTLTIHTTRRCFYVDDVYYMGPSRGFQGEDFDRLGLVLSTIKQSDYINKVHVCQNSLHSSL
jgi:hypothetical protein